MLNHVQELVKTAKEVHNQWKRWVPSDAHRELQSHLRGLELHIPRLVCRKADFILAQIKEDTKRQAQVAGGLIYPMPNIKLKPTALPRFTGNRRDFYRWKRDWDALQKQGDPTGSREVKKVQLLDYLDERITRDLRLTTYNTADDAFRVLENRYDYQTFIATEIVEKLQRMPVVKGHQPRKIVELIQTVEKALQDLSDLGNTGDIKNPLVTKSSKLPETL